VKFADLRIRLCRGNADHGHDLRHPRGRADPRRDVDTKPEDRMIGRPLTLDYLLPQRGRHLPNRLGNNLFPHLALH
jgi:hypothetical protein